MKKKSLLDFQKNWEILVNKGSRNYASLTRDERVWFNIESLIAAADNGGLISHYYNSGADFNKETIEDLSWLGFPEIATSLTRINQLFPNRSPSRNIQERNNVIDTWPDEKYDDLLDELDKQFYLKEPELESALILHIERCMLNINR
jgi:hypothetical protein